MRNTDIAVAVDCDGNYFRVLVWKDDDALADVTPIDKDTFEETGEKHRETLGDLHEFYTLFDHNGSVISEPSFDDDDDLHLQESKKNGKALREGYRVEDTIDYLEMEVRDCFKVVRDVVADNGGHFKDGRGEVVTLFLAALDEKLGGLATYNSEIRNAKTRYKDFIRK
jgi:hypothetical protein